jgi:hypothetical protein
MSGRLWIFLTITTIVVIVGIASAVAYMVDPYGIFRDPAGRKLAIYFSPRKAKFFMNKRYVPANFDGLIVGPSGSANWGVPVLAGERIYNDSLDGANAVEERIVVDQALRQGHFKLAVFILTPAMTRNHEVRDGLNSTRATEAIGSIHVFVHEAVLSLMAAHLRTGKVYATADGQFLWNKPQRLEPEHLDPAFFQIDPIALKNYRAMIQSLQGMGATIVYVVPPFYEPCYQLDKSSLETYLKTIRADLPAAPVIDFDSLEYSNLRNDSNNFFDCAHVGPEGSEKVAALLDNLVPQAIKFEK